MCARVWGSRSRLWLLKFANKSHFSFFFFLFQTQSEISRDPQKIRYICYPNTDPPPRITGLAVKGQTHRHTCAHTHTHTHTKPDRR